MYFKALSISIILIAVLGLHGAPILNEEQSLVARGPTHEPPAKASVQAPKRAEKPEAKPVQKPEAKPVAHQIPETGAKRVVEPVGQKDAPSKAPESANEAHKPTTKVKACRRHQKRSWIWRRDGTDDEDCEMSDASSEGADNELKLHHVDGHTGEEDKTNKHKFTLGAEVGRGDNGVVSKVTHVDGQPVNGLVAKTFNIGGAGANQEFRRLDRVHQLSFSGKDKNGGTHAIMEEQPGTNLRHTATYQAAASQDDGGRSLRRVNRDANRLAGEKKLHHIVNDKTSHEDMNEGNVNYTEDENGLKEAHLMDWRESTKTKGTPNQAQAQDIINGVHIFR
jgi:hypothetical protein